MGGIKRMLEELSFRMGHEGEITDEVMEAAEIAFVQPEVDDTPLGDNFPVTGQMSLDFFTNTSEEESDEDIA